MVYLIVFAIIGLGAVFGSRWRWFQKLTGESEFGSRSGGIMSPEWSAEIVAGAGAKSTPRQSLGKSVYVSTWGIRAISTVLPVVVILYLFPMLKDPELMGEMTAWSSEIELVTLACMLYGFIYVWRFEITLEGTELKAMSALFTTRTFDLRNLENVTENGSYEWKLYFQGHAPVRVLKSLVGASELRQHLSGAIAANTAKNA